jgi:hypothetical protein
MANDRIYPSSSNGTGYGNLSNTNFIGNQFVAPTFMGSTRAHHLISASLLNKAGEFPNTAKFLSQLTIEGLFSIKDGIQNQILLPLESAIAKQHGYAEKKGDATTTVRLLIEQIQLVES